MESNLLTFKSQKNLTFNISLASKDDFNIIYSLQEKIVANLVDKSLFCPLSKSEIKESLELDKVYLVYYEDTLVSYGIAVLNRNSERNLYLTDKSIAPSYKNVLTSEVIVVNPLFRGNNIQEKLFEMFYNLAKTTPNVKVLAGTVSPNNSFSLNNFIKSGYFIYKENLNLYGGYKRNLMLKKLF